MAVGPGLVGLAGRTGGTRSMSRCEALRDVAERRGGGRAASRRPLAGRRLDGSFRMMAGAKRLRLRHASATRLVRPAQ